jgi:Family of unknown function (DUF5681)
LPRFVKGQSGNPGGRRKRDQATVDLLAEIRRQLALAGPEGKVTQAVELVQAMIRAGCGGDVAAAKELLCRMHGRVPAAEPAAELNLERVAEVMRQRRESLGAIGPKSSAESQTRPLPQPPCGFRELDDAEFHAARAVEAERERRERLKHPTVSVEPSPSSPPEPEPDIVARPCPPEPDTRHIVTFPGFGDFYLAE